MPRENNSEEYNQKYGRQEDRRDAGLEPPPGIANGGGNSNSTGCLLLFVALSIPPALLYVVGVV